MSQSVPRIYLDHNATTPMLAQVAEVVARVHRDCPGNPASQHWAGRQARQTLEAARERIGALVGAGLNSSRADRVVFTSGGTEANNLAVAGLAGRRPAHLIVSAIEHPSVAAAAAQLARSGWIVDLLPVTADGVAQVDRLAELIRPETRLVSIMLASNETGVIQPVAAAAEVCAARRVPLHTDAVQVVGKMPVDFRGLGVAALSLSGHKLHAPAGIGALVLRHDVDIVPQMQGGFQQQGLRPGTEPVALAAGLAAALEFWHQDQQAIQERMTGLRDKFEAGLRVGCPDCVVIGQAAARLPHTSNVAFPGLDRQALVMALDLAGVACSTGSACASGSSEPSPTLLAMGCPRAIVDGSLRFSLGQGTTTAEVVEAVSRIVKICKELRTGKLAGKIAGGGRREGPILVD